MPDNANTFHIAISRCQVRVFLLLELFSPVKETTVNSIRFRYWFIC